MSADYSAPSGKGLPFPTAALPTAPTASTPNQSARYTVETITSPGRETPAVQPQDGRLSMSMTMIMPTAVRIASQPAAPQQTTSAKPHRSRRPQHQARSTTARTTTARAASLDAPALVLQTGISSRKRQLHYSGLDVIVLGRRCHNNSRRKVHHGREPLVQSVDRLALLRHSNNGPAHVGLTPNRPHKGRLSTNNHRSTHQ